MQSKKFCQAMIFSLQKSELAAVPELLKVKKMPLLSFESNVLVLRSGKLETSFRVLDIDKYEFDVNRNKLTFRPSDLAGQRWMKLKEAMNQTQAHWLSFMPVAFAVENGSAPTLSSIIAFSLLSRVSRANSKIFTAVMSGKNSGPFSEVWKKAIEHKSTCSDDFLRELAQKLAAIQVSTLTCQGENPVFEIPFGDNNQRSYKVLRKSLQVEESGAGLKTPITFRRDYAEDPKLELYNHAKKHG